MKTIKTKQGDTWDMLAKRCYGNERFMDVLMVANPQYQEVLFFSAGVILEVPAIDTSSKALEMNLPPWKRGRGS